MSGEITLRLASPDDIDGILEMMPRLAMFELPPERNPDDLWRHDAVMAKRWADGEAPNCRMHVAESGDQIVGIVMVSMRPELLSEDPSAHIEAVAVREGFEGKGIGHRLMDIAEQDAQAQGAESITLHVFARNERARSLYERRGFDGELMRYIKRY